MLINLSFTPIENGVLLTPSWDVTFSPTERYINDEERGNGINVQGIEAKVKWIKTNNITSR